MITALIVIGAILLIGFLIICAVAGVAAILIDPLICALLIFAIIKLIKSLRKDEKKKDSDDIID